MKLPLEKQVIYTSSGDNDIVIKIDNDTNVVVETLLLLNKERILKDGLIGECIYKINLKDGDTLTAKVSSEIDYVIKPQSDYTKNKLDKFAQFERNEDKINSKEINWSSIMTELERRYILTRK